MWRKGTKWDRTKVCPLPGDPKAILNRVEQDQPKCLGAMFLRIFGSGSLLCLPPVCQGQGGDRGVL